jgi:hypothetical protein
MPRSTKLNDVVLELAHVMSAKPRVHTLSGFVVQACIVPDPPVLPEQPETVPVTGATPERLMLVHLRVGFILASAEPVVPPTRRTVRIRPGQESPIAAS